MATCGQCGGQGFVTESEYGQLSMSNAHSCYHCAESGTCDKPCCNDEQPVEDLADEDEYRYNGFDCGNDEPHDVDSDFGYDPYAGGPEMDEPMDPYDY